jgi:hypothetical protein
MIASIRVAAVSLLLAVSVSAQKPDFAGTWVPAAGVKPGNELVITQTDKQLTAEYVSAGKPVRKDEIILDGAQHQRRVSMRGAEIVMDYKAAWQNNRLVITTVTAYPNGMKTSGTETWSIDAKGQLVIETAEKGPGGQAGGTEQMILVRKK